MGGPRGRRTARRDAARALLGAYLDGAVTRREVARQIELWARGVEDPGLPGDVCDALEDLFPVRGDVPPDATVVRLLWRAFAVDDPRRFRALVALALRRPLLAAVAAAAATGSPAEILRPGERVLLGTRRGREALEAFVAGDIGPALAWLDRTVLDADAFVATTWDRPVADVEGLGRLIDRLAAATESLPPGAVRAQVAREWISELAADGLEGSVPFTEVARVVGLRLLGSRAPILLWHAAQQLSLVVSGDPMLAKAVLTRCLPVVEVEAGRSPAAAAAPFLAELTPRAATSLLEGLADRLTSAAWEIVASAFLAPAFRRSWPAWRETVRRWAEGDDEARALAALAGVRAAGFPERAALEWFRAAPSPAVRAACRAALEIGAA